VAKKGKRKQRKRPAAGTKPAAKPVEAREPEEAEEEAEAEAKPESEPESEPEPDLKQEPTPAPKPKPSSAVVASTQPRVASGGLSEFVRHLHPRQVRRRSGTFGATLGLGFAAAVCLALATLSGILLMFYYVPSVERAHGSVQDLMAVVPLGAFLRNLHRWSAHAAVACCLLHLLRTLLWGSFRGPRKRVWLVGMGLLVVTLATSFSGYLLPWDQDSYWTVTVGTSLTGYVPGIGDALKGALLGGDTVGQPALTRFFVLHVALLPGLGLVLLVIHLFRLRRAGGLARPAATGGEGDELVPASPWVTSRELALLLLICIGLGLLSVLVDARLGPAPDLFRPDNPPKAPWFLVGVQEMVSYSALWGGFVVPGLALGLVALGPWLDGRTDCDGELLPQQRTRLATVAAVLVPAGAAIGAVLWWGDPQQGSASALNPATIALLAVLVAPAGALLLGRDRSAAVRALLVGMLVLLTVFTIVGWFWRGPDWSLKYHPGPGHDEVHTPTAPSAQTSSSAAPKRGTKP
jgi:cytochrome b-561